jgi:hypothetical protein
LGTKITLLFFLLFFTSIGIAQARKQIQGKIIVRDASPSAVMVLNLNTQVEVQSDSEGLLSILAMPDDVLLFSSKNLDFMRKILDQENYNKGVLNVEMTSKAVVLDEVEIKSYNAVGLGILQKPAKSYTPAERRLKTAGDFKPIHLLAIIGGGMPLDPVFNAINGKTKRLKKEIKLERSQKRLEQFEVFFPKDDLTEQVNVSSDEVMEFTYFVLDKEEFIKILEIQDKNKMLFYLIQMYSQFKNQSQSDEKK